MASQAIAPDHFSPDTREFIRILGRRKVRYVIVGGEAAIFHGHARLTGDVDFFYESSRPNVALLADALHAFWNGSIPGIESETDFLEPGVIVQFGRPPNRIDLLNRIDGVTFEEAWETKTSVPMPDSSGVVTVHFLSRDCLIRNKEAAGRPKDLDDLDYLRG